jgi:hypothetical protein
MRTVVRPLSHVRVGGSEQTGFTFGVGGLRWRKIDEDLSTHSIVMTPRPCRASLEILFVGCPWKAKMSQYVRFNVRFNTGTSLVIRGPPLQGH